MTKKLVLLCLVVLGVFMWGGDLIAILASGDLTALKEVILQGGYWAPLISYALILIQAFISPLPSVLILIANGIIFGRVAGFLISWIGSLSSALLCFGLIRYLGFKLTAPPRVVATIVGLIEEYQDQAVFVARLLPFIPFDVASYAFAMTRVNLRTFMLGTALGQTPAILFYTMWGEEQYAWYVNLAGILVWVAVVSLGYFLWTKRKRKVFRKETG